MFSLMLRPKGRSKSQAHCEEISFVSTILWLKNCPNCYLLPPPHKQPSEVDRVLEKEPGGVGSGNERSRVGWGPGRSSQVLIPRTGQSLEWARRCYALGSLGFGFESWPQRLLTCDFGGVPSPLRLISSLETIRSNVGSTSQGSCRSSGRTTDGKHSAQRQHTAQRTQTAAVITQPCKTGALAPLSSNSNANLPQ